MLIVLAIILVLFYFLSKDNKEKIPLMKRENKHKMRDKNAINDLNFTKIDKKNIFERFEYKCFNCGSKKDLTLDHHYPLAKGYGLKTTDGNYNVVLLCSKCNKKKSNKMPEDFYTTNQLQILSQKYGIGKDILEKSLDINKLVSEKSFVEFIYLGKNYRGQILNILTEETELLGVKNKIYLELDIEGEKNAFLLSEIRNIKKII